MTRKPLAEPSEPRVGRAPRPWLLLCCVLVVVLASYLPVLGAPFVWDDVHLIERTPLVQTLHPLSEYFRQGFWQGDDLAQGRLYYRPLTVLSLALDHAVYGNTPGGFHLTNLALHVVSTALLYWLLRARGTGGYAAVLCAALWGLHPRLTEAVAWISGRTDVLAGFFVISALLVRAREGSVRRTASALLLLLGLLCKEVALAGVVAALVSDWVLGGAVSVRVRRMVPTAIALVSYLVLRAGVIGGGSRHGGYSLYQQVVAAAAAIGRYLVMLLTPWFPNLQIGRLDRPGIFYVLLGGSALSLGCYWVVRHRASVVKERLVPLSLTLVALGLVLHLVPIVVNVVAADRFLYLPLVGLTLLIAPKAEPKLRLLVAGSGLAASFAVATFVRSNTWSDEVELWTETYRSNPDNQLIACTELGRLYARVGLLVHAFSIDEGCHDTSYNLRALSNNAAAVLARSGRFDAAIREIARFSPALGGEPVFGLNLALFRSYLADFPAARGELSRALAREPSYADALELAKKLPELERERKRVDALPENTPESEKARALAKVGLTVPALNAWRACLESAGASREQFEEALWFALANADADTIADFHRRYRQAFPDAGDPQLETAFQAQRELGQRLLSAWPRLGLPLRSLPD